MQDLQNKRNKITRFKNTQRTITLVAQIFESQLKAKIEATGISGQKDVKQLLITGPRDAYEMLGYFRSYNKESATEAFTSLILKALDSPFGILNHPFEGERYGKMIYPGVNIKVPLWAYSRIEKLSESYGEDIQQRFNLNFIYTGCLLSFPKFNQYDEVLIKVPQYRFRLGLDEHRDYDNELAEVIEDSSIFELGVKLRLDTLDEIVELPKYWLYQRD